jgi:anti-sigma factor RsiW
MPRALHAQLAARADAEGSSLNQYIVETLTHALDSGRPSEPAAAPRPAPRSLRLALVANAIVVALAAATCVVLLLVALR